MTSPLVNMKYSAVILALACGSLASLAGPHHRENITITKPVDAHPAASTVLYTSCPPEASPEVHVTHPTEPKPTGPAHTNPLTILPIPSDQYDGGAPSGTATTPASPPIFTGAASANQVGSLMVGAVALAALAL